MSFFRNGSEICPYVCVCGVPPKIKRYYHKVHKAVLNLLVVARPGQRHGLGAPSFTGCSRGRGPEGANRHGIKVVAGRRGTLARRASVMSRSQS